jgi:DNA-binding GntR family transcriptional regulator
MKQKPKKSSAPHSPPLGRLPARQAVYQWLKRRIVLNELRPGGALTELGLAREAGCSQGTIREALLRLQEDGLVLRAGHRGTTVTPLDPVEAAELLALRKRLEMRGAERAAARATPEQIEALRALYDAMVKAAKANDEYLLLVLDMEFHLGLFRIAELPALDQILVRCMLHTHRSKLWAPAHRRPLAATATRHAPILDRLMARDTAGLARVLEEHLDTIVDVVAPALAS